MDVEVVPGSSFESVISDAVAASDVIVVLIGPDWLESTEQKEQRYLDDPTDFVRLEITCALVNKVRVVPVLVKGARMPRPEDLPPQLVGLAHRQYLELRQSSWAQSVEALIRVIEGLTAKPDSRMSDTTPVLGAESSSEKRHPPDRGRVFISFVEEDAASAKVIAQGIEESGYAAWYYTRDAIPGPHYITQILDAIGEASVVIVLVSEHSIPSAQVRTEIAEAFELDKSFIPVLVGMTHAEFRQRRREWAAMMVNSTSLSVPGSDISTALPRMIQALDALTDARRG